MRKRGMLLASEVLKIVLGLIGIALLVYLLVALYFSSSDQKKLDQAEGTLENIKDIVYTFQTNPHFKGWLPDVTPHRWTIFSFTGSELKPNQCAGVNCVCICDDVNEEFLWGAIIMKDRQEKECSEDGACLIIEKLEEFIDIPIKKPEDGSTTLSVTQNGGKVIIKEA
jgi:hypothetical protein